MKMVLFVGEFASLVESTALNDAPVSSSGSLCRVRDDGMIVASLVWESTRSRM